MPTRTSTKKTRKAAESRGGGFALPVRALRLPSDLTPGEQKQLLGMIGIGVPSADACNAIGLHPARLREWMDERNEDPSAVEFRARVNRAEGQGVAQQVKILWDGGRTVINDGKAHVEVSKTICEQHRFLLGRRRPAYFATGPNGQTAGVAPTRNDPIEQEVAEQIVGVLESAGVILPPEVLAVVGVRKE